MSAQDRFERILREQARIADARSAQAAVGEIADRNTLAGDLLRSTAESFRATMNSAELEALGGMSDEEMRAVAMSLRLLARPQKSTTTDAEPTGGGA